MHHRRYVAPTFGERNHALVWKTGLQQAMELVEFWQATSAGEGDSAVQPPVHHDLLSLTLHTVAGAAYGVPMTFLHREAGPDSLNGEEDLFSDGATPPTGFTLSFRQALAFVANNLIAHTIVSALPPWISRLKIPFVLQHRRAHTDFTRYLSALAATAGTSGRPTLLDLLVAGQDSEDDGKKLSREELMGNLFTFTLAGYETTAQTLYYALLMLALQPDTQRWVREGVDAALLDQPADPREWRYETVFPLLVRPLCLMVPFTLSSPASLR